MPLGESRFRRTWIVSDVKTYPAAPESAAGGSAAEGWHQAVRVDVDMHMVKGDDINMPDNTDVYWGYILGRQTSSERWRKFQRSTRASDDRCLNFGWTIRDLVQPAPTLAVRRGRSPVLSYCGGAWAGAYLGRPTGATLPAGAAHRAAVYSPKDVPGPVGWARLHSPPINQPTRAPAGRRLRAVRRAWLATSFLTNWALSHGTTTFALSATGGCTGSAESRASSRFCAIGVGSATGIGEFIFAAGFTKAFDLWWRRRQAWKVGVVRFGAPGGGRQVESSWSTRRSCRPDSSPPSGLLSW